MTDTAQSPQATDVPALLSEILSELRAQSSASQDLWTKKEIAAYFSMSASTVERRIINKNGFPDGVRLPTTENGGHPLWYAKEVKAWATRFRSKN